MKDPESRTLPIFKLSSTVTSGPSQILFPTPWFQVNKQRNTYAHRGSLSLLFLSTDFPSLASVCALQLLVYPLWRSVTGVCSCAIKVICQKWLGVHAMLWVDPKLMTNGSEPMKAQLLLLKLEQILQYNSHLRIHLRSGFEIFSVQLPPLS